MVGQELGAYHAQQIEYMHHEQQIEDELMIWLKLHLAGTVDVASTPGAGCGSSAGCSMIASTVCTQLAPLESRNLAGAKFLAKIVEVR